MRNTIYAAFALILIGGNHCELMPLARAGQQASQTFRYVRAGDASSALESEIRLDRDKHGVVITSITHRDKRTLTLVSRFDSMDRLLGASVVIQEGQEKQTANVNTADGKAEIVRKDKSARELDCPRSVIVTSAPDWTDAFLAVRRFDPDGKDTQMFEGLWIHPTSEPLRPTFKLRRLGQQTVTKDEQPVTVDRIQVELRGGSRYIAWRDGHGRLIRLAPASNLQRGIVLSGWEPDTGLYSDSSRSTKRKE